MKKILSFVVIYFIIVFMVVYVLIGDVIIGSLIVMFEFMVNIVVFYFYEKVWVKFVVL